MRGVLHDFTGTQSLADLKTGGRLSISPSGTVTLKNARDLQEVARSIPEDRLLVETESPFLAPVLNRGKTCEPAFVAETAAFVAKLRDTKTVMRAATTSASFFRLFD